MDALDPSKNPWKNAGFYIIPRKMGEIARKIEGVGSHGGNFLK